MGPTLALEENAGRKLLALFGRAAPRDFADVYRLAQSISKEDLIETAGELDQGFSIGVLAQMFGFLNEIDDEDIAGADPGDVRAFFDEWKSELS